MPAYLQILSRKLILSLTDTFLSKEEKNYISFIFLNANKIIQNYILITDGTRNSGSDLCLIWICKGALNDEKFCLVRIWPSNS